MHTVSPSPRTILLRFFIVLLLACFLCVGCGSEDGSSPKAEEGPGPDTDQVSQAQDLENTDFYGTYLVTATMGSCGEQSLTLIIGNDVERAGEENYVYLPEDIDVNGYSSAYVTETSDGNIKVWRNDTRTISFYVNQDEYDLEITMVFDEGLATGTFTGNLTDDSGCDGDVEGTLALITKNPAEISDAYIQDRIYPNADDNTVNAWVQVSKDSVVMDQAAMLSAELFSLNGSTTPLGHGGGASSISYMYGVSAQDGTITFEESDRSEVGITFALAETLAEGDYLFKAEIQDDGAQYTIKKQIAYPSDTIEHPAAPVITEAVMNNIEGEDYGPITLSWEPLETPQTLYVSFMKSGQVLMMVEIPAAEEEEEPLTTLTLQPNAVSPLLERARLIDTYDLLAVQLHTRQYTDEGMNHARIYSQAELVTGSATGSDIDNTAFYGAYGLDYEDPISITIGDNPDSACFDDYLYLPAELLTYEDSCATVTRDADTLTLTRNGRTTIFEFDYTRETADVSEMLPSGENVVKTYRGTASLITREPAVVEFGTIKGNYFEGEYDSQTIALELAIQDTPIDLPSIISFEAIDSEGTVAESTVNTIDFTNQSYLIGQLVDSILTLDENPFFSAGVYYEINRNFLPSGVYTFVATINFNNEANYTVTSKVESPGNRDQDGDEPVQTGERTFEMNQSNEMIISCALTDSNYDELMLNVIEFTLSPTTYTKKLSIAISPEAIQDNVVNLTIPSETVDTFYDSQAQLVFYYLELETKTNTDSGTVIHRSYRYEMMQPTP